MHSPHSRHLQGCHCSPLVQVDGQPCHTSVFPKSWKESVAFGGLMPTMGTFCFLGVRIDRGTTDTIRSLTKRTNRISFFVFSQQGGNFTAVASCRKCLVAPDPVCVGPRSCLSIKAHFWGDIPPQRGGGVCGHSSWPPERVCLGSADAPWGLTTLSAEGAPWGG